MEQELADEFYGLERRARQRLEEYGTPSVRALCLLRVAVSPAFDPPVSWRLFEQRSRRSDENSYFASYLCWRSDVDLAKFRSPVERLRHPRPLLPTFETFDVEVDSSLAQSMVAGVSSAVIPAYVPKHSIGTDGISYDLTIGDGFVKARYHWWWKAPEPWQPLSASVRDILQHLEQTSMAAGHEVVQAPAYNEDY